MYDLTTPEDPSIWGNLGWKGLGRPTPLAVLSMMRALGLLGARLAVMVFWSFPLVFSVATQFACQLQSSHFSTCFTMWSKMVGMRTKMLDLWKVLRRSWPSMGPWRSRWQWSSQESRTTLGTPSRGKRVQQCHPIVGRSLLRWCGNYWRHCWPWCRGLDSFHSLSWRWNPHRRTGLDLQ